MTSPVEVGMGWRPEVAADLLADPGCVDLVEITAEACYASAAARREARAVAARWPVVLHGVKLSLGTAAGLERERPGKLGRLAVELGARAITEHVAFTHAGHAGTRHEIGHLTQLPRTRAALEVLARNVAEARRHLPDLPLYLENVAYTVPWPDDEMDEASFFCEVVRRTGCDLLLDLGNLHANALNEGRDPHAVLAAYPLEHVRMVHVAGGVAEDGFYFDTHAHPMPAAIDALLAELVRRIGPVPVILERDADFPPFAELAAELGRLRAACSVAPSSVAAAPPRRSAAAVDAAFDGSALAEAQQRLAELLTVTPDPSPDETAPFDAAAVARGREVLLRKRIDDALPLLPRLRACGHPVVHLARATLLSLPRAPRLAAVTDALRIAERAVATGTLERAARLDRLLLRSRFSGSAEAGEVRPRRGPFVGRERLPGHGSAWAFKGPGRESSVRVWERLLDGGRMR
jgi:uncharacterized protein (UPF0276 family)